MESLGFTGNIYRVNGANNLEVRNMSNSPQDGTYDTFRDIWNRQEGDFFRTEPMEPLYMSSLRKVFFCHKDMKVQSYTKDKVSEI